MQAPEECDVAWGGDVQVPRLDGIQELPEGGGCLGESRFRRGGASGHAPIMRPRKREPRERAAPVAPPWADFTVAHLVTTRPMTTDADTSSGDYANLASYRHCVERINKSWPAFAAQRRERLRQGLFDAPVEKIAENILEDLFTQVLDWTLSDVNLQVGRADVVLSELGIKRLVLEVKRPGSLAWHRHAVEAALDQALGYAASQRVGAVAVSDGHMLYAADIAHGGLRDRLFVTLESNEAPLELWWVSVHGIYRPCPKPTMALPSAPTT